MQADILMASNRRDFTSTVFAAPLQFRTLLGAEITRAEVLKRSAGKRVLVMIHGYRVDYYNGFDAYAQVIAMLQATGVQYDVIVMLFWPGSWAYLGFRPSQGRANKAGTMLAELLAEMHKLGAIIDIETHSLGARVGLTAACVTGVHLRNLILTAPAVQDHSLESGQEFAIAPWNCAAVHVCCSRTDEALTLYRATSWFHAALGLRGPRDLKKLTAQNVIVHDYTPSVPNHSDYKRSGDFFADWLTWIQGEKAAA